MPRIRRQWPWGLLLRGGLLAGVGVVAGASLLGMVWPEPEPSGAGRGPESLSDLANLPNRAVTVLVIGLDADQLNAASNNAAPSGPANADALLLVRVNPDGPVQVLPLPWTLCSGGMLYACFFMVTDPVSAPGDRLAQYIYGAFIGAMIVIFRWQAAFAGGVAFAILLGNTVGPTIEMCTRAYGARHPRKRAANAAN